MKGIYLIKYMKLWKGSSNMKITDASKIILNFTWKPIKENGNP